MEGISQGAVILLIVQTLTVCVLGLVAYVFKTGMAGLKFAIDQLRESIATLFEHHETQQRDLAKLYKAHGQLRGEHDMAIRGGAHERPLTAPTSDAG